MVLLFYAGCFLIFSTSNDKIDYVYNYLHDYFKIKYDREINKYIGIEIDLFQNDSIRLSHPYLSQSIINNILSFAQVKP